MNVLYFYILTAGVLAMSSITVDENSLKAKPDVNCQLIEREDFTKAFTEGSALVELHRILQNEIKVNKVAQLITSPSLADAIEDLIDGERHRASINLKYLRIL